MKRGRKRRPTHLKLLDGNPGRRPLPGNEPIPAVELPLAPKSLTAPQRRVWDDVVPPLFHMHPAFTAGAGARRLLVRYCQAVVVADLAIGQIKTVQDLTEVTPKGVPMKNPVINIFREMANLERLIAAEFGMTPSSRAGIDMPKHRDVDDPTAPLRRGD